jgi:hypothetical protein
MSIESATTQAPPAAIEAIEAMPALRAAWNDLSVERCLLRAGGLWLIQRRGLLQRQPEPLPARAAGALLQSLAEHQGITAHGWRLEWADGADGGVAWMERDQLPEPRQWDAEACGLLLQAMRRGVRAAILGAPWSMHDQLLTWIAAHHHASHLFYLGDALPETLDAERVFHLYPPEDAARRRRIARLTDGAQALFWERIEAIDDLRAALGPADATSRWISINALDLSAGAEALLTRCREAHIPAPELLAFVERDASGMPVIARLQILEDDQWKDIFGHTQAAEPPAEPSPEPQPKPAPVLQTRAEVSAPPASLRTSAEIALRELGLAPGEAAYQPAASTINELFEDSESDVSLVRESGELTFEAAIKAQELHVDDPDETSELAPLHLVEAPPRAETPLFGSRQIARAASKPSMQATKPVAQQPTPEAKPAAPAPAPLEHPEPPAVVDEDDDPATRELDELDLAEPSSEPELPTPHTASRIRDTLDEAPPLIHSRPTLQVDDHLALSRVSGEDFVLEEYLQQRATREASVGELVEMEELKAASLDGLEPLEDIDEVEDAVTGNVPSKVLQELLINRASAEIELPEATSSEYPALQAIEALDDLYALDLPPARIMDNLGTEPSLRAFQSIPQQDLLGSTSPAIQTHAELSWSEDEDTHHRLIDEALTTEPHKPTLQTTPEPAEDPQHRRSALSQRLRALSQQRQQRSEAEEGPAVKNTDETRQQTVNKEELLWRLRQQLQDDDL